MILLGWATLLPVSGMTGTHFSHCNDTLKCAPVLGWRLTDISFPFVRMFASCGEVNMVRLMSDDVFTVVCARCLLSTSTGEGPYLSFGCFSCPQCILKMLRSLRRALAIRSRNCLSCSDRGRGIYSQGCLSFPCLRKDTHAWPPLLSSLILSSLGVCSD